MCEQFFESDGDFFFQGHFKFREEALAGGMGTITRYRTNFQVSLM